MERWGALGLVIAGLGLGGVLAAAVALSAMRKEEPPPEEEEPPLEEPEEIVDATLRRGWVWWAGLTEWEEVHIRFPNEWPLDTDITFSWEVRNTGNVGAYFQVYMFDPGEWLYIEPGEEIEVREEYHTPVVPVSPGYQFYTVTILGRKITGERVGAVWTSDEIEVSYV